MGKILVLLVFIFMVLLPMVAIYKVYGWYKSLRRQMGFGGEGNSGFGSGNGGEDKKSRSEESHRGNGGDRPIVNSEEGARRMDTIKGMAVDAEVVE